MIDEIFDRTYRDGRTALNADLSNVFSSLAGAVRNAFTVLNRIEYRAPWFEAAARRDCR